MDKEKLQYSRECICNKGFVGLADSLSMLEEMNSKYQEQRFCCRSKNLNKNELREWETRSLDIRAKGLDVLVRSLAMLVCLPFRHSLSGILHDVR